MTATGAKFSEAIISSVDCWRRSSAPTAAATSGSTSASERSNTDALASVAVGGGTFTKPASSRWVGAGSGAGSAAQPLHGRVEEWLGRGDRPGAALEIADFQLGAPLGSPGRAP